MYHNLGRLLQSGVTIAAALEKLSTTSNGGVRALLTRLRQAILNGATVGEAFKQQRPAISSMEASILASVERSGQLEHGCHQLARYFQALAESRELLVRKSAYPLFILHFAIFSLSIPTIVQKGTDIYLKDIGMILGAIYIVGGTLALLIYLFVDMGSTHPAFDRILRAIPLFGSVRSAFANSRFCMVYGLELNAGVNVIDALLAAGRSSRSALILAATKNAAPKVREGSQVGPLLVAANIFPDTMTRSILVGEDTGALDQELERLASDLQTEAFTRLQTTTDWSTKALFFAVILYVAYRIVSTFQGVISDMDKLLNF